MFALTTNVMQRNYIRYHGFIAAIVSWMGHGVTTAENFSPASRNVHSPLDTITDFTAGEKCRMNGFLPGTQFGGATTIGVISVCTGD